MGVRVAFQSVSYTFGPTKKRKQKKGATDVRTEAIERQWGNDPDHRWALRDVTFTLEAGEFLGVAGHTGSGKSTLMLALAGLIKPTEGAVLIDDGAGKPVDAAQRRGAIGLVFQYPEHQLFAPTVLEDVSFGPRNLGLDAEEVQKRALAALERVGLDAQEIAARSPFQLSGGQQRRVALAGVLAMEPAVLAMDEPAAGLDPRGVAELIALVRKLNAEGTTIVMISHRMADLAAEADRVLMLNEGRVAALGTPEAVFDSSAKLKSLGLAAPPSLALAERLRAAGLNLPQGLLSESELIAHLTALGAGAPALGARP